MQSKLTKGRVYTAGICSIIVTMGVARFSYTPMIPIMQAETGLSDLAAGWLATANYLGYMLGVLIAASMNNLQRKYWLHQGYLLVGIVTAGAMVFTTDIMIWSVLRFLAGMCSAGGTIIASGLILKWMVNNKHRPELGIHFAGVGISIVLMSVVVETLLQMSAGWQLQWLVFSIAACLFAIPSWLWLPKPPKHDPNAPSPVKDSPPSQQFILIMLFAYFCAGYGYAVSATYIVDIVERLSSMEGWGQYIFIVVGLSAIPAVMLWDLVARRVGYLKTLLLAYAIQVVSIMLPTMSENPIAIIMSAALFGGTFVPIVSLVLTMAGRYYPSNPAKFMGKMTVSYGVAQIIAPIITAYFVQSSGNYNLGLYFSAGVILLGMVFILKLIKLKAIEDNVYAKANLQATNNG